MTQKNTLHRLLFQCFAKAEATSNTQACAVDTHPSMEVKVDFEKGKLSLQSDWSFLKQFCEGAEETRISEERQVSIQMNIAETEIPDLDEIGTDGLILWMDGDLCDGSHEEACLGILLLDKKWNAVLQRENWHLTLYIHQVLYEKFAFKFDLPVFGEPAFHLN